MITFTEQLQKLCACSEAVEWVNGRGLRKCWQVADRADWMLWLAGKCVDRKTLVLAACDCAETALKYVPKDEDRPAKAIETTRAWCDGRATIKEVRSAAAAYAYAAAARHKAHKKMCRLIRKRIPVEMIEEAL